MKSLLSILLLSLAMQAQSFTASGSSALPDAPSQHPFWTVENKVNVGILAGLVAADSALGFGAGVGVVYLLHRGRHYKAERITMRLIVAGEGGFVANNIIAIR